MFSRTFFQPLRSTALQHRVLTQTPTPCRRPLLPSRLRFMSSSPSPSAKQTWVVYAPDKTEPGTLERRQSVRSKHLERVAEFHDTGYVKLGGAIFSPDSVTPGATQKKMVGSVMFFQADSIEDVKKSVESDIYYTSGVWDPEKLVILPFNSAFPWP